MITKLLNQNFRSLVLLFLLSVVVGAGGSWLYQNYSADSAIAQETTPKQKRGPAGSSGSNPNYAEVGPPRCVNGDGYYYDGEQGTDPVDCKQGFPQNQKFIEDDTYTGVGRHHSEISGPLCPFGFWRPHNRNECFNWPRHSYAELHVVSLPVQGVVVAGINRCPESKTICGHGTNLGGTSNYSKTSVPYIDSTLTVSSVPAGYSFSSWSGCDSVTSNGAGCNVLIDSGEVQRVVVNLVQN